MAVDRSHSDLRGGREAWKWLGTGREVRHGLMDGSGRWTDRALKVDPAVAHIGQLGSGVQSPGVERFSVN